MSSHGPARFQSTSSRWRAIAHRDAAAHCSFFYGVTTTRIYCRPTCTARLARRANVVYYDTREQAQHDGFRPCARCKPDDPVFLGQREDLVTRTLGLLRDDSGNVRIESGVEALAQDVGVTPSYLCRAFKKTMGCTLGEYCRLFDTLSVGEGAKAGFSQPSRNTYEPLSKDGKARPNQTPALNTSEPSIWSEDPQSTWSASQSVTPDLSLSGSPSVGPSDSWAGIGEPLDIDFDFDSWVWTEGLDINGWIVPNVMYPSCRPEIQQKHD